jgi:hypothetical protein
MTKDLSMIYILAGFITFLFIVQVLSVVKLMTVAKQMNSLLFEMRILFKKSGLFYNKEKNQVIHFDNCQYCKNRISFVQITDAPDGDQFYYRCKIKNIEVHLADSCEHFERDHSIA